MKTEDLIPKPTNKEQFKLACFKFIPQKSGCYILTTFTDDILYIGLAENLNSRFKQHLNNAEKTNPTINGKAVWFHYMIFDQKNLPSLERTWLNQFLNIHAILPILNKVNSPLS